MVFDGIVKENCSYDRRNELKNERISLCDALDKVINKGVVAMGEIIISVADVDLLYLNLQCVLSTTKEVIEDKT